MNDFLVAVDHTPTNSHHLVELTIFSQWFELALLPIDVSVAQHRFPLTTTCERLVTEVLLARLCGRQDHIRLVANETLYNIEAIA